MADYNESGRLIISRAKQLDKIPETSYNCNSDDLQSIITHVDGERLHKIIKKTNEKF